MTFQSIESNKDQIVESNKEVNQNTIKLNILKDDEVEVVENVQILN